MSMESCFSLTKSSRAFTHFSVVLRVLAGQRSLIISSISASSNDRANLGLFSFGSEFESTVEKSRSKTGEDIRLSWSAVAVHKHDRNLQPREMANIRPRVEICHLAWPAAARKGKKCSGELLASSLSLVFSEGVRQHQLSRAGKASAVPVQSSQTKNS